MNTNIRVFLFFLESILVTSSNIPSKTGILPVMEFLDKDLVQVDYSASFNIPDFSTVTIVSVFEGDNVHGIASRENYSDSVNIRNTGKYFQPLEENSKLKVKLNSCFPHSFYVTILFSDQLHLDSGNGNYKPENFRKV